MEYSFLFCLPNISLFSAVYPQICLILTLPDDSFSILSLPQQQKNKCLLRWRFPLLANSRFAFSVCFADCLLAFTPKCCCGTLYHSSLVFTAFLKGAPGCYLPPAGFVCIKEMPITIQTCGEHLIYFFSALEYSNLNTAPFFDWLAFLEHQTPTASVFFPFFQL